MRYKKEKLKKKQGQNLPHGEKKSTWIWLIQRLMRSIRSSPADWGLRPLHQASKAQVAWLSLVSGSPAGKQTGETRACATVGPHKDTLTAKSTERVDVAFEHTHKKQTETN